ncbi:MAG: hypothetical protein KIT11_10080 [Fimbriimonadaceae bacterium]|nr:hypothetical protein [Fimbriimonadaceae bacterium]QYK55671.1 MAG: hypothetical protein KF733_11750 [Fimbriimonadaceae bacterium]
MVYTLFVSLDSFYTSTLLKKRNELAGRAFLVHREKRVLDSSREARARQVYPGIPLSEAKAILREEGTYVPYDPDDYLSARNHWLDICALYSSVVQPDMPHEAWIGLDGHPNPSATAFELASDVAHALATPVRAGLSKAAWVSKLSAIEIDPYDASSLMVVDDIPFFLRSLPTSLLTPIPPEDRQRLEFLGYRRAGSLLDASNSALKSQFKANAFLITQVVKGKWRDYPEALYPLHSLTERIVFDSPADNSLMIQEGIATLANQLANQLSSQDSSAESITLYLEYENGKMTRFTRKLTKTVQTSTQLRTILTTLLKLPCTPPIALRCTLASLRHSARSQKSFEATASTKERRLCADSAIGTMLSSFGTNSIVTASRMQTDRRTRLLRHWRHCTGWKG